jgi:hypothetical protein
MIWIEDPTLLQAYYEPGLNTKQIEIGKLTVPSQLLFAYFFGRRKTYESNGFITFVPSQTWNINNFNNDIITFCNHGVQELYRLHTTNKLNSKALEIDL